MELITLNKPAEINSKRVNNEVRKLIYAGIKSWDINLILEFTCPDKTIDWISNEFRKLKNRHAFDFDNLNRVN